MFLIAHHDQSGARHIAMRPAAGPTNHLVTAGPKRPGHTTPIAHKGVGSSPAASERATAPRFDKIGHFTESEVNEGTKGTFWRFESSSYRAWAWVRTGSEGGIFS